MLPARRSLSGGRPLLPMNAAAPVLAPDPLNLPPSLAVLGSRLAKASYQLIALQEEVKNYKHQLRLHQEQLARLIPPELLAEAQQQLAELRGRVQYLESSRA